MKCRYLGRNHFTNVSQIFKKSCLIFFILIFFMQAADGSRVCSVSYSSTSSSTFGDRKNKPQSDDVWENLSKHLKGEQVGRFTSQDVRKELDILAMRVKQEVSIKCSL